MKRPYGAVLLLLVFMAPAVAAHSDGNADATIAAYFKWRGGDAIGAVSALSFSGTLETAGLSGAQTRRATAEFIHEEIDLETLKGGTVIGPDGAFTRTTSGQVQVLGTDLKRSSERMLDLLFATSVRAGKAAARDDENKENRTYHVFRIDYENGDAWDYFVAPDGALDWVRLKEDNETVWMALSNWRTIDGVRFAATEKTFYKEAERNTHTEWRDIEVNPKLADDAFKRLVPERKLLSFSAGTASETMPVDLFMGVRVFVPVTINGVKTLAILDSGAEATGIDAAFAKRAGLTGKGTVSALGSGGSTTVSMANDVTIEMPGAKLTGMTAFIADLSELTSRFGRPLEVILGQELFNEAVVDVDYPHKTVTFHDAETYRYSGSGDQVPLIAGKGGLKQVELSIEGHDKELFDFDLGNGRPLIIVDDAAMRWGLHDGRKTAQVLSGGIGGSQVVGAAKVRDVTIGRTTLHNVPTLFPKTDHGSYNTKTIAGNVGAGLFNRFRVIVDLTRDVLYLEPDASLLDQPFEQDRAGLDFRIADGKLTVIHVVPGSPAAAVGFSKGDVVTAIGETPITEQNWAETARDQFRQPSGTRVTVTLADGRKTSIVLADYF